MITVVAAVEGDGNKTQRREQQQLQVKLVVRLDWLIEVVAYGLTKTFPFHPRSVQHIRELINKSVYFFSVSVIALLPPHPSPIQHLMLFRWFFSSFTPERRTTSRHRHMWLLVVFGIEISRRNILFPAASFSFPSHTHLSWCSFCLFFPISKK